MYHIDWYCGMNRFIVLNLPSPMMVGDKEIVMGV